MDAEKFGTFLQSRRKELGLTQAEVGEKLHVTAKAVSRWERGIGFPDIKLLQPLADALEITLAELMHSEKIEQDMSRETADRLVQETVRTIRQQKEQGWKQKLLLCGGYAAILCVQIFLIWVKASIRFPAWIDMSLYLLIVYGGSWFVRAWKTIITGEYPQNQPRYKTVVWTWKTYLALLVSLAGLILLLYVMRLGYSGPLPKGESALVGLLMMLGGGISGILLTEETSDE